MTKILFIHHGTGWGGAPISLLQIINTLDKSKYDVEVLLIRDSIVSKIFKEHGIKVKIANNSFYRHFYRYYTHSVANEKKWFRIDIELKEILSWLLNRYYFAKKEIKNYNYDIVHLNSSVLSDWIAPCKKKGKVIIHIREPFTKGKLGLRYNFFKKQISKYADKIITISNDNARRINIPEKTKVIYNFIEIKQNCEIEKTHTITDYVLYVGGNQSIKGFHTVVDSLDYLSKDIKIVFCGNYQLKNRESRRIFSFIKDKIKNISPEHKKMNVALKKIKSHPNAIVVGLVEDTKEWIKNCEFLISPFSKPHFSRPVLEAFACKKCVIGTDVEGMEEIIDHNVNGLIIKKNNPILLAKAINYLHANPKKSEEYGKNGFLKASKLFSSKSILQIQEIYEELSHDI